MFNHSGRTYVSAHLVRRHGVTCTDDEDASKAGANKIKCNANIFFSFGLSAALDNCHHTPIMFIDSQRHHIALCQFSLLKKEHSIKETAA